MGRSRWTASAWLDASPGLIVVQFTNVEGPSIERLEAATLDGAVVVNAAVEDLEPGETRQVRLAVGNSEVRTVVVTDGSEKALRIQVIV